MRAARIKLVATDVDGVLTDAGVYYSDSGEAMKRFSLRDGMGVERLRDDGIETAFVTRERSPLVARRAEKLSIRLCYLGIARQGRGAADAARGRGRHARRGRATSATTSTTSASWRRSRADGLIAAPADAFAPRAAAACTTAARSPGGHGAFRDFAEWILGLREADPRTVDMRSRTACNRESTRLAC